MSLLKYQIFQEALSAGLFDFNTPDPFSERILTIDLKVSKIRYFRKCES